MQHSHLHAHHQQPHSHSHNHGHRAHDPHNAAVPLYTHFLLQLPSSPSRFLLLLLCVISAILFVTAFLFLPLFSAWLLGLVLALLKLLGFLLLALLFALWWFQPLLLYMPSFMGRRGIHRSNEYNSVGFRSPAEHDLPYSEHYITTSDGVKIHAWLVRQPAERFPSAPTVIFLHGNAGNIGFRLLNVKTFYHVCRCNILMLEYRGYGNSGGECSELGLKRDSEAALQFLYSVSEIDRRKIFLFGRSLGGAVAVHLAHSLTLPSAQSNLQSFAPLPLCGLILENTFTSIQDMVVVLASRLVNVRRAEPLLRLVLRLFMTSHWHSLSLMPSISAPVLMISGLMDELVPPVQMKALYDSATSCSDRQLYSVPGGDHNSTYIRGGGEYWKRTREFIVTNCQRVDDKYSLDSSAGRSEGTDGVTSGDSSPTASTSLT